MQATAKGDAVLKTLMVTRPEPGQSIKAILEKKDYNEIVQLNATTAASPGQFYTTVNDAGIITGVKEEEG